LSPGDLLMTRSNTEQLVGHVAIYNGSPHPCIYPDLMMRIPVDPQLADTRFVYFWLRSPATRAILEAKGSGTSSTMKKITQQDVMSLPFPATMSLPDQQRVASQIDATIAKIDVLRETQSIARDDLDALFPALLDRAFFGGL